MMTRWGKDQLRNLRAFAVAVAALAFAGTALAQTKLCKPGESCRLALPTAGVYMGIQAYPYITDSENQICADQECSIQVREGPSPFGIDRKFALHLHYYGWDTLASELALDPTCTGAGSELCDDYQNGRVPVISWECDGAAPPKGYHSTDEIIEAINLGEPADTDCDNPVSELAQEYCSIKKTADLMKLYPTPVLLRWFWEFNLLSKNQSCRGNDSPPTATDYEDFEGAWRRIWTIFQNEKASNVLFLWNPGDYVEDEDKDPHSYYPGNQYVDWLGIDSYQRSTTDVFADNIDPFYSDFTQPAFAGKPLMVGENGSPNFAMQNEEVQDTYLAVGPNSLLADFQRKLYPRLKAYDYFDSDNFDKGKKHNRSWVLEPPTTYMISGISVSAGVVTVVLSAPSGIAAGDLITVAGASPSKYNGVNFAVRTSIDNGTTLTYVDETAKGAKPGTTGRIELGACGADCGGVDALTGLTDSPAFNAIPRSAASSPIVRMVCSVSLQLESVRGDVVTINVKTASPTGHAVAAANCPWSVGPLPSWIRLQNPALGEGLGPGTVTLQLLPTAALEQATVEIGGAFIPVHQ